MPKSKKSAPSAKKGSAKKQDPEIVVPPIEDTEKEEEPEFDPAKKVDDFADFMEPDDLGITADEDGLLDDEDEDDEDVEDDSDAY